MLLFFVRHGDPIYNPDSLTELGKRQAEAVGRRIAVHGIDRIFSSTSNRAYQTGLPLAELTKKEITKEEFLEEGNAWRYFAIPDKEGKQRWAYGVSELLRSFAREEIYRLGSRWYEHPDYAEYSFKEGVEFFDSNADRLLLSLGYEHNRETHTYRAVRGNSERVAIFAHEGVGCAFLSSVLDIPYAGFASHYAMSHSGMTVIKFDEEGEEILPKLMQFSSDSHIYKEGLPTYYHNVIPI